VRHIFSAAFLIRCISIATEFCATVLLADFVSGVLHWLEDAYGSEKTPVIGKWMIEKNILHHYKPRQFTQYNWLQSNWDLACVALVLVIAAWASGHLTWQVWLFAILSANANEIHKWAHRTPRENGRVITFLQRYRLIQTVRHHAKHHTNPKDSNYCTLTDFLNPVLDGANIWERAEGLVYRVSGVRRRVDTSVKQPAGRCRCSGDRANCQQREAPQLVTISLSAARRLGSSQRAAAECLATGQPLGAGSSIALPASAPLASASQD
jgi:ubiquitin-conjugating enzyme E2 variant